MKKNYTFIALLLLTSIGSYAQVNYTFIATTASYTPVAGGTTPALINRPYDFGQTSSTYDEGIANNIPIGFTFNYNGAGYTAINICANGFATLGSPFLENLGYVENFYINNLTSGPLSPSYPGGIEPNTKPVLAPLWDDLNVQQNSNLRYLTTGSAGSRVFTFEWSNALWQYDATAAVLSFELKLYEGTNVIEFCYKDEGGTPSAGASASIGITASDQTGGGFMSLQNTSASPSISTATEVNALNSKPANNQVYRFTPLPCNLPLNLTYNSLNTSVNFSWVAPVGVNTFEYAVNTSPSDPASGISTTTTNATVAALSPGTSYYIHLRSFCSASSQSVWYTQSFTTTNNNSPAPPIAWQKSIGGSGFEGASSIKQTADGGYIMASASNSNDGDVPGNHGWVDVFVVKLSSTGGIQWAKNYGGTDYDDVASIIQTSDGGYIFIGFTQSINGDVVGNHGQGDIWLVKLNDVGTIQWQKCLGGNNVEIGLSVNQTADGGYIISGATDSNDGDVSGNHDPLGIQPDIWIAKLDNTGNVQWQKCLGGTEDEYASVKQVSDGGYIVCGSTNSTDGDVIGNHGSDIWVVKLNSGGNLQWQKCLGGSGYDDANSIEETSDGAYVLAGSISSGDGDVTGDHSSGDIWIVKINNSGDILWQKFYGGSGSDNAGSIKITSDGGFIVAGTSSSNDGDINGNHGGSDAWLIKLDANGNFQWQKCMGGTSDDRASYSEQTTDNGYIVGGSSDSNNGDATNNHGGGDSWVIKLGPDVLLPITLVKFSGEVRGKQNLLHWTTANELNNTGFEIQRSNDGANFNRLDFITTKAVNGSSNRNLTYDFTDANYVTSTNYYRLKQVDKDGRFSYSNIVVLKNNNPIGMNLVNVYPNPAKNILNVKTTSSANNKITLFIADLSGRIVMSKVINSGNSEFITQLNITGLAAGTYLLSAIDDGGRKAVKKFEKH